MKKYAVIVEKWSRVRNDIANIDEILKYRLYEIYCGGHKFIKTFLSRKSARQYARRHKYTIPEKLP